MLQQILQDMWVDPQILAELDDDQKQTLFCRMREEQVRRWQLWDQQQHSTPRVVTPATTRNTTGEKRVGFLLGKDGEPWVWVMGEHPDDKSIDEILEQEARDQARRLAELETEQMRESMEAELSQLLDLNAQQIKAMEHDRQEKARDEEEAANIYCSVDELMKRADRPALPLLPAEQQRQQRIMTFDKPSSEVSQRVTLWERKVTEERTSEIFRNLQMKKAQVEREAQEAQSTQEHMWQEQERRAKEAETQIREIARRAREQHRRTSVLMDSAPQSPTSPVMPSESRRLVQVESAPATPPDRDAVVQWYRCSEVPRGAGICLCTNTVQPWFHGLISRQEAECLLHDQPISTFLVRVSERIWGYAISYRDADRCKHYLVDASNGHYQFLGSNHVVHDSLADMVEYHASNVITVACNELLKYPCPRVGTPAILQGVWP